MAVTIEDIKKKLEGRVGSPIQVVAQSGRKRQIKHRGILSEVYKSLFVVNLNQEENNYEHISYSYSDILTKAIEISFSNDLLTL